MVTVGSMRNMITECLGPIVPYQKIVAASLPEVAESRL